MFINKPEMAKEWASKTNFKKLPEKSKNKKEKKKKAENLNNIEKLSFIYFQLAIVSE